MYCILYIRLVSHVLISSNWDFYWDKECSFCALEIFSLHLSVRKETKEGIYILEKCGHADQVHSLNWPWPTSPSGFLEFELYLHLSSLGQLDVAQGFLELTMEVATALSKSLNLAKPHIVYPSTKRDALYPPFDSNVTYFYTSLSLEPVPHLFFGRLHQR